MGCSIIDCHSAGTRHKMGPRPGLILSVVLCSRHWRMVGTEAPAPRGMRLVEEEPAREVIREVEKEVIRTVEVIREVEVENPAAALLLAKAARTVTEQRAEILELREWIARAPRTAEPPQQVDVQSIARRSVVASCPAVCPRGDHGHGCRLSRGHIGSLNDAPHRWWSRNDRCQWS